MTASGPMSGRTVVANGGTSPVEARRVAGEILPASAPEVGGVTDRSSCVERDGSP